MLSGGTIGSINGNDSWSILNTSNKLIRFSIIGINSICSKIKFH